MGRRLRDSGLLDAFRKILKGKAGGPAPLHEGVDRIFIRWDAGELSASGKEELGQGESYNMHVIVACRDEQAAEAIGRAFALQERLEKEALSAYGIDMDPPMVETLDQITLAHTAGYTRLGDWDYFSGMAEFAAESRQD